MAAFINCENVAETLIMLIELSLVAVEWEKNCSGVRQRQLEREKEREGEEGWGRNGEVGRPLSDTHPSSQPTNHPSIHPSIYLFDFLSRERNIILVFFFVALYMI